MFGKKSKWVNKVIPYVLSAVILINYQASLFMHSKAADYSEPTVVEYVEAVEEEIIAEVPVKTVQEITPREIIIEETVIEEPVTEEVVELPFTDEEIELIALVTMAEAEGESEEGKQLVIDTILNRVDHERFPDSVTEVIYQPNQFTSMWNGRVDKCYVDEDICELVKGEIENRSNTEVIFFTAGDYGKYGTPMFAVGNHYFSSYA